MLLIAKELNLSLNVIGIIARFLINDDAYGTCAALNMTSSLAELETTPLLEDFRTMGCKKCSSVIHIDVVQRSYGNGSQGEKTLARGMATHQEQQRRSMDSVSTELTAGMRIAQMVIP